MEDLYKKQKLQINKFQLNAINIFSKTKEMSKLQKLI